MTRLCTISCPKLDGYALQFDSGWLWSGMICDLIPSDQNIVLPLCTIPVSTYGRDAGVAPLDWRYKMELLLGTVVAFV